jgi:hypothetical protein
MKKINQTGLAHLFTMLLVVVVVGVVGVGYKVAGHADSVTATASKAKLGHIIVTARTAVRDDNNGALLTVTPTKANLYVFSTNGGTCNGVKLTTSFSNLGPTRRLECTKGKYVLTLEKAENINTKSHGKYKLSETKSLKPGQTIKINLGSKIL